MSIREKYRIGDLFKINDIVINRSTKSIHEIIDCGTNYLTVVDNAGAVSKMWLSDAVVANELTEDFNNTRRRRSSSSQIAFVGYKSKHFNKEIFEAFKQTLSEKTAKTEKFVTLNTIRQTDNLIEALEHLTINNYSRTKALFEQTEKYLNKLNIICYHTYRSDIRDKLNEFEIFECLTLTGIDREKVISIIAESLNLNIEEFETAEEKINACATKVKYGKWPPEAWKLMGNMFNQATILGIKWNKSIFEESTQKVMGLK